MAHDINARPTQRRYPAELRERAVRLVLETIAERGDRHGAVTRVAQQLGVGSESLRLWVRQAEIDGGQRGGLTTMERAFGGPEDRPLEANDRAPRVRNRRAP